MFYNLNNTVFIPGKMAEWSEIFEKEMIPILPKLGIKIVGSFRAYTGNMNEVYQLFSYDDLAARQRATEAARKDKEYQRVSAKLAALAVSLTYTLLETNPWSPMK
jgi:hypothetical protein